MLIFEICQLARRVGFFYEHSWYMLFVYEHSWHMLFCLWTFPAFIRKSPTRVLQLTHSRFAVVKSPTRVLQSVHALSVSPVLDCSIVWTFLFRERARWSLHRLCICTHPAEPAAQPKSRAPDAHQRSQKHASSTRIVQIYMIYFAHNDNDRAVVHEFT